MNNLICHLKQYLNNKDNKMSSENYYIVALVIKSAGVEG